MKNPIIKQLIARSCSHLQFVWITYENDVEEPENEFNR